MFFGHPDFGGTANGRSHAFSEPRYPAEHRHHKRLMLNHASRRPSDFELLPAISEVGKDMATPAQIAANQQNAVLSTTSSSLAFAMSSNPPTSTNLFWSRRWPSLAGASPAPGHHSALRQRRRAQLLQSPHRTPENAPATKRTQTNWPPATGPWPLPFAKRTQLRNLPNNCRSPAAGRSPRAPALRPKCTK
jgi:hypothetical protein